MSEQTITYTGTLRTTNCWCGIHYAVPDDLYDHMLRQRDNGKSQSGIYCPLGHTWTFAGKGAAVIERERRERAEAVASQRLAELDQERASHAATRGQLTRAKKRAAAAVCPCCNRSFANVRRHLANMHPDYLTETLGQDAAGAAIAASPPGGSV